MAKRFDELGAILFSKQVCYIDSCSVTLTLTTAMQMLPLTAATSFEHRGAPCLLTLTRSTSPPPPPPAPPPPPPLDQFPVRVCSCPL